jgi:arginine N-succinyltransferase
VYATLFPDGVRRALGKVAPETEPVRHLLEKIGFEYVDRIDPFDGGPHYEAKLEDVSLVRAYRRAKLSAEPLEREAEDRLVAVTRGEGKVRFRALRTPARLDGEQVRISAKARDILGAEPGERVHLVPFE